MTRQKMTAVVLLVAALANCSESEAGDKLPQSGVPVPSSRIDVESTVISHAVAVPAQHLGSLRGHLTHIDSLIANIYESASFCHSFIDRHQSRSAGLIRTTAGKPRRMDTGTR